jgi:hypothetical protein
MHIIIVVDIYGRMRYFGINCIKVLTIYLCIDIFILD